MDKLVAETAFNAEIAAVDRRTVIGSYPNDFAVLYVEIEIATSPAICAGRLDLLYAISAAFAHRRFFHKGAYGAGRYALTAEDAVFRILGLAESRVRDGRKAPSDQIDSPFSHDLMAYPDAPSAEDAFVRIEIYEWIIIAHREVSWSPGKLFRLDVIEIGEFLKVANACLFTYHTIVGMIGEDE
jgi:hypothetical protein